MKRLFYRIGQFRRAWMDAPSLEGLARAEAALTPPLFELFCKMLPFEQAHAIRVYEGLIAQGVEDPDLLAAGLLHDVGKAHRPLRPWERAFAVAVRALLPGRFQQWGCGEPEGLRAGIVVAARHAEWGAEMAAAAGAGERLVRFIRVHDANLSFLPANERPQVSKLQSVDTVN